MLFRKRRIIFPLTFLKILFLLVNLLKLNCFSLGLHTLWTFYKVALYDRVVFCLFFYLIPLVVNFYSNLLQTFRTDVSVVIIKLIMFRYVLYFLMHRFVYMLKMSVPSLHFSGHWESINRLWQIFSFTNMCWVPSYYALLK